METGLDLAKTSGEELLNSGFLSDAEVFVGDKIWKVHKCILCSRSAYFKKAFTGSFQEAQTGRIFIREHSTEDMDLILTYLYTCQLDFSKFGLVRLLEIYKIADYFVINHLQTAVVNNINMILQHQARSIWNPKEYIHGVLNSSSEHWSDEQLNQFFSAARTVYDANTDTKFHRELRKSIMIFLKMTFVVLGKDIRFIKALKGVPELAVDLVALTMDTKNQGQRSMVASQRPKECSRCHSERVKGFGQTWYSGTSALRTVTVAGLCYSCADKEDYDVIIDDDEEN
ncbi:uncharacterized protein PG998_012178 [Apiospora kogelbergensis]|uniref:uncharacterized protein n=1 Tax=Apiospora kogelbergensis TaxID=1337665 RepID=UPI003130FEF3